MAGSVYWLGADGNVYLKGASGVQNAGKAINLSDAGFDASGLSAEATRINDPNPPPGPANPNGNTGGTAPAVADKSNDIALQNAGLGAVDTQTSSGLSAIDKALGTLIGQYDTEAGANEGNFKTQSDTNQNNLQKNKQSALVNAAQGRQGLFGTLSSLGALNGSGIDLANRAVQKGANDDLNGAADNFGTNQSSLDTAIGTFRQEDKERRDNANTSADNARTNTRNEAAKSKQTFYSNLANDFAAQGDAGEASRYTGLASALYPEVAATSIPNSNIAYTGAAFTPGTLASYLAGANSTAVTAAPVNGGGIPGLTASNPIKKKQLVTA